MRHALSRATSISLPVKPPAWAEGATACRPSPSMSSASVHFSAGDGPTPPVSPPPAPAPTSGGPDVHWPRRPPRVASPGMQPDATYKYVLSSAFMVEELMRWLVAERHGLHALVEALDFSTLTRVHEQSVTGDGEALRRHANDMVWRVHLRDDDAEPETPGPWLYLVVMLEFQSTVDYLMALRIRSYVDRFHTEQWRGRRFGATDRLAPVLPIVLYIGRPRWSAAARVIDLVTPGASGTGHGEAGTIWQADSRFAGDGYVLLDSHRVGPEDLRRDNAAALLAGLENPLPSTLPELVGALCRRLRAPELRELREMMLSWAGWRARQAGLTIEAEDMAQVNRMENPDDVEAFYMTRAQRWEEERRAEGRVAGQRESLRRHAAMKFDVETAERLGALLETVSEQEVLDDVLAALLECDTPSELLARAEEVRRRANGLDGTGAG